MYFRFASRSPLVLRRSSVGGLEFFPLAAGTRTGVPAQKHHDPESDKASQRRDALGASIHVLSRRLDLSHPTLIAAPISASKIPPGTASCPSSSSHVPFLIPHSPSPPPSLNPPFRPHTLTPTLTPPPKPPPLTTDASDKMARIHRTRADIDMRRSAFGAECSSRSGRWRWGMIGRCGADGEEMGGVDGVGGGAECGGGGG